jgi:hypothetical protein
MNLVVLNEVEKMLHTSPSLLRNSKLLRQAIVGIFDVDIHDVTFTNIGELVDRIDNAILDRYFREIWQPETKKFKYSGLRIITEVNSLKPRNVLDVGCGYNEFKHKINNLIGLDPYNKNADVTSTILNYKTETKFDVILALGSINFGSTDKIFSELEKVVNLTNPGGKLFFRVNPGLQHNKPESKWISFYPWSTNFVVNAAAYLGVDILDIKNDNNNRMYFLWGKPA